MMTEVRPLPANRADHMVALLFALSLSGYSLVAPIATAIGTESRLISVPYRAGVVLLSVVALVSVLRSSGDRYSGPYWLLFGVFWLLYTLRLLNDTVFNPAVLRLQPWEYLLYAYGFCLLPALACLTDASDGSRALMPRYVLGISFLACVAAIGVNLQAIRHGTFAASILSGRFALETLNPITFGELGAITSVVSCWQLLRHRGRRRFLLVVPLVVGLACTAVAGSRGPVIGLAIALTIVFVGARMTGTVGGTATLLGMLALGIVFIGGSLWIEQNIGFRALSRFASSEVDESGDLRRQFMSGAWRAYVTHPLLGAGLDEPTSGEYPHNLVIESFMSIGTLGGLAFLTLFLGSVVEAIKLFFRRAPEIQLLVALFAQQTVSAMLSGALYLTGAFWCTMAVVLGSSIASQRRAFPVAGEA